MTVDEVGEEEDSIIEPDIPELQEESLREETSSAGQTEVKLDANTTASSDEGTHQTQESNNGSPSQEKSEDTQVANYSKETQENKGPSKSPQASDLNHFPTQEFKAALEETCSTSDMSGADAATSAPDCLSNHLGEGDSTKPTEADRDKDLEKTGHITESEQKETRLKEDSQCQRKGW